MHELINKHKQTQRHRKQTYVTKQEKKVRDKLGVWVSDTHDYM